VSIEKGRYNIPMCKKVTLDTNCFFDYFEREPKYVVKLIDLALKNHIELAMTTRVLADTHDKWKKPDISPIWKQIQSFPLLETIGSVFRSGVSRSGSKDFTISKQHSIILGKISSILKTAQTEDIDHMFGHIVAGRDIFITSDNDFLDHKDKIKGQFGVDVFTPKEAVEQISKIVLHAE